MRILLAVVLLLCLLPRPTRAQQGPPGEAKYLSEYRGTYLGDFPRLETELKRADVDIRLIVDGTRYPGPCGYAEWPKLGCKARMFDCSQFERSLRFELQMEASVDPVCSRDSRMDAELENSYSGFYYHNRWPPPLGGTRRLARSGEAEAYVARPAQVPEVKRKHIISAAEQLIEIPACSRSTPAEVDVAGEYTYGAAGEGEVVLQQQGTCVAFDATWSPLKLRYVARGTLVGRTLLLRWQQATDKGSATLDVERSGLTVREAQGPHTWRGTRFTRGPKLVVLPSCLALVAQAEDAAKRGDVSIAHERLKALSLLLARENEADTRWRTVSERAQRTQQTLSAYPKSNFDLAWNGAHILLELAREARARGDQDQRHQLVEGAESAVADLEGRTGAIIALLNEAVMLSQQGEVMRRVVQSSPEARAARDTAQRQCLLSIDSAKLDEAATLCAKEDALLRNANPDAVERASSSAGEGAPRSMMKMLEAEGERIYVASLQARIRHLDGLSAKASLHPEIRKRAATWAARLKGEIIDAAQTSGTLRDLETAREAVQAQGTPVLRTPRSIDELGSLYRSLGFSGLFREVEKIESEATAAALRAGTNAEVALRLLSFRKGKSHQLEAQIGSLVRTTERDRYAALRALRGRLSAEYLQHLAGSAATPRAETIRQRIFEVESELGRLAAEKHSQLAASELTSRSWLTNVSSKLAKQDIWLSYHRYHAAPPSAGLPGERYALYAVEGQSNRVALFDLGPAGKLDKLIEQVVEALRSPATPLDEVEAIALKGYAALLGPCHSLLQAKTTIWLSPDSRVALAPFDGLRSASGWLADHHELRIVEGIPEPGVITKIERPARVVVFAEPTRSAGIYQDPRLNPLAYSKLPMAEPEAQMIRQRYGSVVDIYRGEDAREEVFDRLRSPDILHFAGHGLLLSHESGQGAEYPRGFSQASAPSPQPATVSYVSDGWLQAMLVLTPPSQANPVDQGIDGFASAYELSTLDLHGTRLVFLAACETALGSGARWFGVNSLQNALHVAGATHVVGTLWEIADEAGFLYAREFYTQLAAGMPVPRAASLASASLRHSRRHSHPSAWAAFTLSVRGALWP